MTFEHSHELQPNPESEKLEFSLVWAGFAHLLERAKHQQAQNPGFRMFTIATDPFGLEGAFARIRAADSVLSQYDLRAAIEDENGVVDIGIPVKSVDINNPEPSDIKSGRPLLIFKQLGNDQEQVVIVTKQTFEQALADEPDLLSKSLGYTVVPIRKDAA